MSTLLRGQKPQAGTHHGEGTRNLECVRGAVARREAPLRPSWVDLRKIAPRLRGSWNGGLRQIAAERRRSGSSAVCQSGHSGSMLVAFPVGLQRVNSVDAAQPFHDKNHVCLLGKSGISLKMLRFLLSTRPRNSSVQADLPQWVKNCHRPCEPGLLHTESGCGLG